MDVQDERRKLDKAWGSDTVPYSDESAALYTLGHTALDEVVRLNRLLAESNRHIESLHNEMERNH